MSSSNYVEKLLITWESTYKQGQLSFWILLSLKTGGMYMGDIKTCIERLTVNHVSCEDQSLYRALRKFYDLGIVDFTSEAGFKGPERKNYFLTDTGQELLKRFIERNITLFYKEEIRNLIQK